MNPYEKNRCTLTDVLKVVKIENFVTRNAVLLENLPKIEFFHDQNIQWCVFKGEECSFINSGFLKIVLSDKPMFSVLETAEADSPSVLDIHLDSVMGCNFDPITPKSMEKVVGFSITVDAGYFYSFKVLACRDDKSVETAVQTLAILARYLREKRNSQLLL